MEKSKIKLSVVVPSIRPENLGKLWGSIHNDLRFDFEFIVISPYDIPKDSIVANYWIKSKRSPNACQQQGLMLATGEYITFASDDGVFLPGALDKAINALDFATAEDGGEFVIVGKYLEGDTPNPDMGHDDYYKFRYHKAYRLKGVPQNDLIFNCGVIRNSFIRQLGGWDSEMFEATTMAHADLGIRAVKAGARMILMPDIMFKCSHQPGNSGDHRPVNQAMKRDIKNFQKIYKKHNDRINIEFNNWQNTPEVWEERFK